MPRVNPPVGKSRRNVYVDNEQYELFKKMSKSVNYTFTDMVNDSLKKFNNSIKNALETGDSQALTDIYKNRLDEAKNQLEEYRKNMR